MIAASLRYLQRKGFGGVSDSRGLSRASPRPLAPATASPAPAPAFPPLRPALPAPATTSPAFAPDLLAPAPARRPARIQISIAGRGGKSTGTAGLTKQAVLCVILLAEALVGLQTQQADLRDLAPAGGRKGGVQDFAAV